MLVRYLICLVHHPLLDSNHGFTPYFKSERMKTAIPNTRNKEEREKLIGFIPYIGSCMVSDKITVEGELVGFMYREQPDFEADSGWRFLSDTETQEYADDLDNWGIYDTKTIANYDHAIIPYVHFPIGTALERVKGSDTFW